MAEPLKFPFEYRLKRDDTMKILQAIFFDFFLIHIFLIFDATKQHILHT